MRITIDGNHYELPATLHSVTLSQRIDFDKQHGKGLRDQLKKLIEIKDPVVRDIDFTAYHCQLACKTLSFFAGIPLDIVEQTKLDEVLTLYHELMKGYSEDIDFASKEFQIQNEFIWNDETWVIAAPELKHDSAMNFGEFLDAKQWVKNLYELSQEKYESLLMLCCVYFRKKGEKYTKELCNNEGPRCLLLKTLPFDYAMHVGFFLSASMSSYMQAFHSSVEAGAVQPDLN